MLDLGGFNQNNGVQIAARQNALNTSPLYVARYAGDVERLAAIVALDDGDHLRRELVFIHQAADSQRAEQTERDFRLHVGELLLEELRAGQRLAELLPVEAILASTMPAIFGCAENTPGDAIAGAIEAAEGAFEA